MSRNLFETVMGAVVLTIVAFLLFSAYIGTNLKPVAGYRLTAKFGAVGALPIGSEVRIGGIKIGSVVGQSLDTRDFRPIITMSISSDIRIPEDTVAAVTSDGLLGGKYVRLEVGQAKTFIRRGGRIKSTRDALSIEEILSRAVFLLSKPEKPNAGNKTNK